MFIGNAANLTINVTGTATAARVATLPDNTGTIAELNLAQTWTGSWTITPASAIGLKIAPSSGSALAIELKDAAAKQRFYVQPSVTFSNVWLDTDGTTGLMEVLAGQSTVFLAGTQGGTTHTMCRGTSPQTGDLFLVRNNAGTDSLFGITATGKLDVGAPGGA